MVPLPYTEDALVQQTTAEHLRDELGWRSVMAYNSDIEILSASAAK